MSFPSLLKSSKPGPSSAGHQQYTSQAGAPRLRPSRAAMLPPAPPPRIRDDSRTRYSSDSFSDEFYHPPRRAPRWRALSIPAGLYKTAVTRFGRRRGPALLCLCCLALLLTTYAFHRRFVSSKRAWPSPYRTESAPLFSREDRLKIWEWEVRSGHYPTTRPIPAEIGFPFPPHNPSIPLHASKRPSHSESASRHTAGSGPQRIYPEVRNRPPDFGHPPRPIPGSIADFDRVLEQCDFDTGKYHRDCHEFMRIGAGLDNSVRLRREDIEDLRYVYVLDGEGDHLVARSEHGSTAPTFTISSSDNWKRDLTLPPIPHHRPESHRAGACSEDEPRVFHMFWAGPFTDKPYMAIMAFLYTQNLGLHLESPPPEPPYCRPQLWLWMSRGGPAEVMPVSTAEADMLDELRSNPWSFPFLHERFNGLVRFRLWNTTEQLDSVAELRDDWRKLGKELLRSDGKAPKDELDKKVGSSVSLDGMTQEAFDNYNKIPVIISDMARFVLCHRFGGVYLDVDMLFLRDWEELWNWPGAFSYRWSWENLYNTAVLRLRRGSALGSFLLRTALAHGLDFHPISVTHYLRDAHLEGLLFRLPDALFDPAWQNCDFIPTWPWGRKLLQRDRPPQPFITDFDQFFNTPPEMSGMPSVIGFDGFYRGAYVYHYHNEWWKPFDRARYWPDLGPRFVEAERIGRAAVAGQNVSYTEGFVAHDERDLTWATVLKRTFEAYIRGERPNMYGEWIRW